MDFEKSMQHKVMILTALFFVRHQGGSEALDGFLTFAKKSLDSKNTPTVAYEAEMEEILLVDDTTC